MRRGWQETGFGAYRGSLWRLNVCLGVFFAEECHLRPLHLIGARRSQLQRDLAQAANHPVRCGTAQVKYSSCSVIVLVIILNLKRTAVGQPCLCRLRPIYRACTSIHESCFGSVSGRPCLRACGDSLKRIESATISRVAFSRTTTHGDGLPPTIGASRSCSAARSAKTAASTYRQSSGRSDCRK